MPAPFFEWLQAKGYTLGTAIVYTRGARRIARSLWRLEPERWLADRRDPSKVDRASVRLYREWLDLHHPGDAVSVPLVPRAHRSRRYTEPALSDAELERYLEVVRELELDPAVRTLLLLIPLVGVPLRYLLELERWDFRTIDDQYGMLLKAPRGRTFIPIGDDGRAVLRKYLTDVRAGTHRWLFPSPLKAGHPRGSSAVEGALRERVSPRLERRVTTSLLVQSWVVRNPTSSVLLAPRMVAAILEAHEAQGA